MKDGKDLTDDFEKRALERAREYGKELSPEHACDVCARIDLQPWQDEKLKEIAGWQIDEDYKPFFRQAPEPPTDEHMWFLDEVMDVFRQSFHDNAASPDQCDVCMDPDLECGHERHDPDGCPV